MPKNLTAFYVVGWAVLAVVSMWAALTYGRYEGNKGFAGYYYGLPLTWGVNQLWSVTGPMNSWEIDFLNFLVDFVFWLAIFLAPLVLMYFKRTLTESDSSRV